MAIPPGLVPVSARMDEVTSGVIFDTLSEPKFPVYTLPAASMAIQPGLVPVSARMDEVPSGVIFG